MGIVECDRQTEEERETLLMGRRSMKRRSRVVRVAGSSEGSALQADPESGTWVGVDIT